jgi:hypothetical protein
MLTNKDIPGLIAKFLFGQDIVPTSDNAVTDDSVKADDKTVIDTVGTEVKEKKNG